MKGYAMELVLNDYCIKNNIPIKRMILKGVRQTMKPYKNKNGVMLLAKEILELALVFIKLKIL